MGRLIALFPEQLRALQELIPPHVDSSVRIEVHAWNQFGVVFGVLFAGGEAHRAMVVKPDGSYLPAPADLMHGDALAPLQWGVENALGPWQRV